MTDKKATNTKQGSGSKPAGKPEKRTVGGGQAIKDAVGVILDQRKDGGRYIPKDD